MDIACERGEVANILDMGFLIQYRLVEMRNAPALGNVELEQLGERIEKELREELARKPALEKKMRIEQLLARLAEPTPAALQSFRAVTVLERINNTEAR